MNRFIRLMPQVSRRRLPKEVEERIYQSFKEAIKLIGKDEEADLFFNDLLTRTEKVMIPKRFAIAILLSKGVSYDSVKSRLNVTQSTIASVAKTLDFSKGYRVIIEKLNRSEVWRSLWQDIESLLYRFSLPGKVFIEEGAIRHKIGLKKKTLVR